MTHFTHFQRTCALGLALVSVLMAEAPARADQTIADNLIVQGNVSIDEGALAVFSEDTPTVFLSQTPGGFGVQDWSMSGNEIGLFFEDITSGSFPFGIETGAPDDSLRVSFNGFVGIGTFNPVTALNVVRSSQVATAETLAQFEISDDPVGRLVINNNSTSNNVFHPRILGLATSQATPLSFEGVIATDAGTNPCISFNAARSTGGAVTTRPLVYFRNNVAVRARIEANGDMFATSFNPVSSRTRKDQIVDLDSSKAADAFQKLTPVEFVYKDDETGERRVGFIAEDVPELVANADRQSVPIMDVVALVTRVVKDQQQTIDQQQATINAQRVAIDEHRKAVADQRLLIDTQQKELREHAKSMETLMQRLGAMERRMEDR